MAVNSETEINLKTLQRVDSNIIEIIDHASQVAIYRFERKLNKWEGTDIEGTLFLYRRNLYPFHGFIIVNRMSTTNFVEDITSDMEFLLQEPYFLYKKSCGEIIGSWFYEECDFRRITNKIQSIVLKQVTTPKRQRCSSDSDSQLRKDDTVQDIMSLLSDAHTEYIKREINDESPQENLEENFNDLSSYSDKKISNKSVNACGEKSTFSLRASSEEKYPVSPRRRFLSTGSYDPNRFLPLTSNKILNELVSCSNEAAPHREDINQSSNKLHSLNNDRHFAPIENFKSPSHSSRLSPLVSQSGDAKPILSGVTILDQTVEPFEVPLNSHIKYLETQKTSSGDYVSKLKDAFPNASSAHSLNMKETLISHLEWNSDILLKIHEAYVASLKSIFIPKKS